MATNLSYDVFLSHSTKDQAVVRPMAERLRQDGLRVWFDEWVLKTRRQHPGEDRGSAGALARAGALHVGPCVRVRLGAVGLSCRSRRPKKLNDRMREFRA